MCWGLAGFLSFPSGERLLCSSAQCHVGSSIGHGRTSAFSPYYGTRYESKIMSAKCEHNWGNQHIFPILWYQRTFPIDGKNMSATFERKT